MLPIRLIHLIILLIIIVLINVVIGMNNKELEEPLLAQQQDEEAVPIEFEVIEDGTSEEEDMAKAFTMSKTWFWREMIVEWNCENGTLKKPEKIGLQKSFDIAKFCEYCKIVAIAADAYVKGWECEKTAKNGEEAGTSSSSSPKHLRSGKDGKTNGAMTIRQRIQINIHRKKLLYFLIYTDRCSDKGPTDIQLENEKACELFGNLIKNRDGVDDEKHPLIELFKTLQQTILGELLKIFDLSKEESSKMQEFYRKFWNLALENGFDFIYMCNAGRKFKKNLEGGFFKKHLWLFITNQKLDFDLWVSKFKNEYPYRINEQLLGEFFMDYKKLNDQLPDVCDQAKLKVKKESKKIFTEGHH